MIGRYGKSLECFEYELTIENSIEYAAIMQGFCYYKLRDYKKSLEIFGAFKEKYPDMIVPRFYIALCYTHLGDTLEALMEYTGITTLRSDKQESKISVMLAFINQAIIHLREGRITSALYCTDCALAEEMQADEMKQLLIDGAPYYELKYKENMTFEDLYASVFKEWTHYELLFALGTALIAAQCDDIALLPLAKAHSLAPDTADIDAHIAYILFNKKMKRDMFEDTVKNAIEGKSNKLFELFELPYNANLSPEEFIRIVDKGNKW